MRIDVISYVFTRRAKRYRRFESKILESKRCTPDSRLYLRDTLLSSGIRGYQRYEGVNINLVELNVDDVEGSLPNRVKS